MTFLDAGHQFNIELTPEEMLTISQEISRKFAPNPALLTDDSLPFTGIQTDAYLQTAKNTTNTGFSEINHLCSGFSCQELQTISQDISSRFAPRPLSLEPEVVLLPVDPHHLYAYWNSADNPVTLASENAGGKLLTLRIYWRPDENPDTKSSNVWFDVDAGNPESRQKISVPLDNTAYSASLGTLNPDHSLDILAHSNIIHVPTARPGQIKMAPIRHYQPQLPDNRAFRIAGANQDRQTPDADNFASINYEIKGFSTGMHVLEQSWQVKLHINPPLTRTSAMANIDSNLLTFFNEKGISVELIPKPELIESSDNPNKNASGQGM